MRTSTAWPTPTPAAAASESVPVSLLTVFSEWSVEKQTVGPVFPVAFVIGCLFFSFAVDQKNWVSIDKQTERKENPNEKACPLQPHKKSIIKSLTLFSASLFRENVSSGLGRRCCRRRLRQKKICCLSSNTTADDADRQGTHAHIHTVHAVRSNKRILDGHTYCLTSQPIIRKPCLLFLLCLLFRFYSWFSLLVILLNHCLRNDRKILPVSGVSYIFRHALADSGEQSEMMSEHRSDCRFSPCGRGRRCVPLFAWQLAPVLLCLCDCVHRG